MEQVLETMGVQSQIEVTADIGAADAVLALRSKLKHNTWVRGMAKYRQLPIFAIKVGGDGGMGGCLACVRMLC